ncbi:hypothetical protein WH47_01322 [Habropoda laboriosa]|uniref:Uncharacterized protein n=1 Tax=Habropoda laboriosa TaxID=597456 RepID=A0A0L7R2R8_9HYME|nr:hypothetical protein WH47_01322 [Habropoda laboriosa]
MSANVARDEPMAAGTDDFNNRETLYPIEVCEATIAFNETQNPERRQQRVKEFDSQKLEFLGIGSFLEFDSQKLEFLGIGSFLEFDSQKLEFLGIGLVAEFKTRKLEFLIIRLFAEFDSRKLEFLGIGSFLEFDSQKLEFLRIGRRTFSHNFHLENFFDSSALMRFGVRYLRRDFTKNVELENSREKLQLLSIDFRIPRFARPVDVHVRERSVGIGISSLASQATRLNNRRYVTGVYAFSRRAWRKEGQQCQQAENEEEETRRRVNGPPVVVPSLACLSNEYQRRKYRASVSVNGHGGQGPESSLPGTTRMLSFRWGITKPRLRSDRLFELIYRVSRCIRAVLRWFSVMISSLKLGESSVADGSSRGSSLGSIDVEDLSKLTVMRHN